MNKNTRTCPKCDSFAFEEKYKAYICNHCGYMIKKNILPLDQLDSDELTEIILAVIQEHGLTTEKEINCLHDILTSGFDDVTAFTEDIFEHEPVGAHELLYSDEYFGDASKSLYPKLQEEFLRIIDNSPVQTIVLGGSLGYGKTFLVSYLYLACLYYLACLKNPQAFYGLSKNTRLSFYSFAVKPETARKAFFDDFIALYDMIPWLGTHLPRDMDIESEIRIPSKKIVLRTGGPNINNVIGTNVHTFFGDELNFMDVIEESKRSVTADQSYDAAKYCVETFSQRQDSRFTNTFSYCPPRRFLASSERLPDDFLPVYLEANADRILSKEQIDAKDYDPQKTYIYHIKYSNWQTKPPKNFPGWTLISNDNNQTIYFDKDGKITDETKGEPKFKTFMIGFGHPRKGDGVIEGTNAGYRQTFEIPLFYKDSFTGTAYKFYEAVRNILGHSVSFSGTWFTEAQYLKCVNHSRVHPCSHMNPTMFEKDFYIDYRNMGGPGIVNPGKPRFVHLDLSKTNDHTGMCISHVSHTAFVLKKINGIITAILMPFFYIDFMLKIKPPSNGMNVDYEKIRQVIFNFRARGMNIKQVTYDKVEGEMRNYFILNQIESDYLSLDMNISPWHTLSDIMTEGRLNTYDYPPFKKELEGLYYNEKKRKIEHPKTNAKDISDAVAGSIWGAYQNFHMNPMAMSNQSNIIIVDSIDPTIESRFNEDYPNFLGSDYVFPSEY